MPDDNRSPESRIPFTRDAIKAEQLPWDDFNKVLDRIRKDSHVAWITDRGNEVALVIPMKAADILLKALEDNPEWATQGPPSIEYWTPASEVLGRDFLA